MKFFSGVNISLVSAAAMVGAVSGQTGYKFDFGPGPVQAGYTQVVASTTYNKTRGYGFDFNVPVTCADRGGADSLTRDNCYGSKYFYFSMNLPEGNYKVSVTLGDATVATVTTVKAESRRLFVEKADNAAGRFTTHSFIVNRRNVAIAGTGNSVGVSDRELGGLNWDGNKLTLEFSNAHPSVASMEVSLADAPVQIFLAGNSTQCDWATESETAWGQMFTRFFKDDAVVVSLAEAGLTGTAFINQRRLDKIMSLIKPGDYLLAEFAHNDMGAMGIAAYQANFKTFITQARSKNAIPVIVTPTPRRTFSGTKPTNSFVNGNGDYLAAVKQVARDQSALLIDMNACGSDFIEKLGPSGSAMAYWYNPASGQDNTHWNRYGAFEIAKCVAQGVKDSIPALAAHLAADFAGFDPKSPDPVDTLRIPPSADTAVWHRTVGLSPGLEGQAGGSGFSVNPANQRVGYVSDAAGDAEFSIFQLDGKKMAVKTIGVSAGGGSLTLDAIRVLPKGLYFLQMKVDGRPLGLIRFLKG